MLWKLLVSLAALLPHQNHKSSEQHTEFIPTPYGPQSLQEEAEARRALYGKHYGGDMILSDDWNTTDAGIKDEKYRWKEEIYPGHPKVPYVLHHSIDPASRDIIKEAMEQYYKNTCIRFVKRTTEKDYVFIFFGDGCWSYVGRLGGKQELSLGRGCWHVGLVIHELGHAIGLFHEHQRSDRDKYITVYPENVALGYMHNFNTKDEKNELIFTNYDYDSIMHYGNYAFSKRPYGDSPLPTMTAKNGQKLVEPYEKPGFTKSDIETIRKLYKCE